MVQMEINMVVGWYQTAMTVQNDAAQLQVYQTRANSVEQQISQGFSQTAAANQAQSLLYEKRSNQVYLYMLWFYQEVKQLEFFSLSNYNPNIPANPSTNDLIQAQINVAEEITLALESHTTAPTQCWSRLEIPATQYPNAFSALKANRSMLLPIVFPNTTNYYMVFYNDVHLYLQGNNVAKSDMIVQLGLTHQGESYFLSQSGEQWNFTHSDLPYSFFYNSTSLCPTSSPYSAPNYINYSPFGYWNISVPNQDGLDITQVTSVAFEFQIYFYQHQTPQTEPLFGRDSNWESDTCVAPLGSSCEKMDHTYPTLLLDKIHHV